MSEPVYLELHDNYRFMIEGRGDLVEVFGQYRGNAGVWTTYQDEGVCIPTNRLAEFIEALQKVAK